MSTRHITCINKDHGNHLNPHKAIERLGFNEGGTSYTTSRLEMYRFLKAGGSAYVKDRYGNTVYVYPAEHGGTQYVQTHADGKWTDNLLALPECSVRNL